MIRDDWLLRQIAEMVDGLAGVRQEVHDRVDLDASVAALDTLARQISGLSLEAVDGLPALALHGLVPVEKRGPLAELLAIAADIAELKGDAELARIRRTKADALR